MKGELKILPSGRTPFNWTLPPELRKKFDFICEQKGYIKQAEVDRMVRWWINTEEGGSIGLRRGSDAQPPAGSGSAGDGPLLTDEFDRGENQSRKKKNK